MVAAAADAVAAPRRGLDRRVLRAAARQRVGLPGARAGLREARGEEAARLGHAHRRARARCAPLPRSRRSPRRSRRACAAAQRWWSGWARCGWCSTRRRRSWMIASSGTPTSRSSSSPSPSATSSVGRLPARAPLAPRAADIPALTAAARRGPVRLHLGGVGRRVHGARGGVPDHLRGLQLPAPLRPLLRLLLPALRALHPLHAPAYAAQTPPCSRLWLAAPRAGKAPFGSRGGKNERGCVDRALLHPAETDGLAPLPGEQRACPRAALITHYRSRRL